MIITRGFGISDVEVHIPVAICEPEVITHEYGERTMVSKELKPVMAANTLPKICKEEGEE